LQVKDIFKFLSFNVLIQVLGVIFNLLVIKILTLDELGKYNLAKGLSQFFLFAHLGLRYSLDRRLPKSSKLVGRRQLNSVLILNSLVSILLFVYIVFKYGLDWQYLSFSIGGALFSFFALIKIYYRGIGDIKTFMKANYISGLLPLVLSLVAVLLFGLKGLTVAYLLSCIILFMSYYNVDTKFNTARLNIDYLKKMFLLGFPLLLSNVFVFLADTYDRFIIESYTDLKTLGEFSIITFVYTFTLIIPSTLLEAVFPEYIKNKNNNNGLKKIIKKHLMLGALLISLIFVGAFIFIPIGFNWIFPQYNYLLDKMQIILFAFLPHIFIPICWSLLFANNKGKEIMISSAIAVIFYISLLNLVLSNGSSLKYIILAKLSYSYIYLIFLCLMVFLHKVYPFKNPSIYNE
jgi:O-antigen/teichoic acid export membrane protein